MKKRHLLVLACISVLSVNSFACKSCKTCKSVGVKANSLSFTVGGGKDYLSSRRHIQNADVGFVAAEYTLTRQWGFEALVGFFNTTFTGDLDRGHQTNGNLVLFDAMFHFPTFDFVQPYALAGVGITSFSSNRTDGNNQGNINAGLGLQFHVNEVVSFKVDVRDIYTLVGGYNDIFIGAGVNFAMQLC